MAQLTISIHGLTRRQLAIGAAGLLVSLALATAAILYIRAHSIVRPIPVGITGKALFTLYYPSQLPAGYTIDQASFQYRDDTVIFGARNDVGNTIAFTEQAAPKDFDFNNFYQGLAQAKKLTGVPYQSITGMMPGHTQVISIVPDSTWILITSHTPLDQSALESLAAHLRKQ